jgi:hypothetical protein
MTIYAANAQTAAAVKLNSLQARNVLKGRSVTIGALLGWRCKPVLARRGAVISR